MRRINEKKVYFFPKIEKRPQVFLKRTDKRRKNKKRPVLSQLMVPEFQGMESGVFKEEELWVYELIQMQLR
jgi:hypothetical protein